MNGVLFATICVLAVPVVVLGVIRFVRFVERGERPRGEWAVVAREPGEPGAQDVVGWVAVDNRNRTGLVYCVNCATMTHRWASWPIRRWSHGANTRCVECAMFLHDVTAAKASRGSGDKVGGLSVARSTEAQQ